jgi:hypothetical protein
MVPELAVAKTNDVLKPGSADAVQIHDRIGVQ